jgi:Putative transmembrane protein (PGPGW)
VIQAILDFAARHAVLFLGISIASFVVSIVLTPWLILRIPANYFTFEHRHRLAAKQHPLVRLALVTSKNVLGWILIIAGLLLFVLPGQGLITMLVGLLITDYPGKYALERWLVMRPRVLPTINWLRTRWGRLPLVAPQEDG